MAGTLFIFGDEFGTMPVEDNDGPFLAAALAIREARSSTNIVRLSGTQECAPWFSAYLVTGSDAVVTQAGRETTGSTRDLFCSRCRISPSSRKSSAAWTPCSGSPTP
jgi:hypothetical protein